MNQSFYLYVFSVLIASLSQLLLKKSASRSYDSFWREYLNLYVAAGYGLLFLSMLLTIFAYRGMDYKNGPVIESLGYVLVLLLGRLFFGEHLTKKKMIGTLCILTGMIVFYL